MILKNVKKLICMVLCAALLTISAGCVKASSDDKKVSSLVNAATSEDKGSSTNNTTGKTSVTTTVPTSTSTTKVQTDAKSTDKLIALTFDDGPYSPVTEKILDTLEKYNARATFFVVGDRVATYSSSVKRAYDMGCEIASHSYSHKNLTKLSAAEIKSQITKSNDAIKKVTGSDITAVRPPEGAVNDAVRANVSYPLVMWSVDSLDWKNRDATKNYNNVINSVFDGSIVLMHDLYPATADAVAKLVPKLIEEGYKFVTFDELMQIRGVDLDKGTKYFSAKPKKSEDTTAATTKKSSETTKESTTSTGTTKKAA